MSGHLQSAPMKSFRCWSGIMAAAISGDTPRRWSLTAIDNSFVPQSRVYSALEDLGLDHKSIEQKVLNGFVGAAHDNVLIVGRG